MRSLECPTVAIFDPMGFGWTNFEEDNLDWPDLTNRLRTVIWSDEFRSGKAEAFDELHRLYREHVDNLNCMGCGWFAGFVAGAAIAYHADDVLLPTTA